MSPVDGRMVRLIVSPRASTPQPLGDGTVPARLEFAELAEIPVNHRPRLRGVSKYGVHNRLWRGIRDCFGVRWFTARAVPAERVEGGMEQGRGQ